MSGPVSRLRCPVVVTLGALLNVACDSEFASQMQLAGYRVIGVEASPPEVSPDDALQLRAHDFYDGGDPLRYDWSLCLHSLGANSGYECSDEALELNLGRESEQLVDLSAAGIDLRERLSDTELTNPDGTVRNLESGFDIWFTLDSGPECAGCESIRTVKRVFVREEGAGANQNPVIERLSVEGEATPGGNVTLRVETDRPELYVDAVRDEERREEYLYSWYTSAGKTDPSRSFGQARQTELRLPDRSTTVEVVVAVRDERGGLAVERLLFDLE